MSYMNVKRATQAFSKADTSGSAQNARSEGVRSAGATEMEQAYGDQNVGDIANKITNPNWVDPSKKTRTAGDPSLGKDAFMKLMLTQMKHQDPTSPLQSHEMAAQLAQFTSLEQLNNINTTLEGMKTNQAPQTNYQALALIGKKVSGDASKLTRAAGDTKHGVNFELMQDAQKVRVTIKDAAGTVVRKLDSANLKKGSNGIEWNGLNEEGSPARPGEYRISVEGVSSAGKKVFAKTSFEGRITGLNYTPEGPILLVGNATVKLADVRKIEESAEGEMMPGQLPGQVPGQPMGGAKDIDLKLGATTNGKKGGASAGASGLAEQTGKGSQVAQQKFAPVQQAQTPSVAPAQAEAMPAQQMLPINPMQPQTLAPTPKQASAAEPADEDIPPAEESTTPPGNIDMVPMASGLMAQIAKETK